jgi:uncharacterized protein YecA (UPF0149 family)
VTWLDAWADVLRLCDAAGIGSIEDFDDRFPLTQSLYNWSQDLEMALESAGRDDGDIQQALIEFCEESLRRFPGVRDRADIAERLKEMCEDSGRPDEARQFGEQAERLRREHLRPAARPVLSQSAGQTTRRVKVGRNDPCPCGSGKKFKKCCGSPAIEVRRG